MRKISAEGNRKRLAAERRMRVFEIMGVHEWEAAVLIRNMDLVCKWLESGTMPIKVSKPARIRLADKTS